MQHGHWIWIQMHTYIRRDFPIYGILHLKKRWFCSIQRKFGWSTATASGSWCMDKMVRIRWLWITSRYIRYTAESHPFHAGVPRWAAQPHQNESILTDWEALPHWAQPQALHAWDRSLLCTRYWWFRAILVLRKYSLRRLQSFTLWLCSDVDPCLVWHLITWVYRFEFILGPLNFAVRGFVFAPQWPITRCLSSLRGLVRQKIMVIGGLGPNPNT